MCQAVDKSTPSGSNAVMAYIIENITEGDLPRIMTLEREIFDNPFTSEDLRGWLDSSRMIMRKIGETSAPAGYLIASSIADESELYRLAVAAAYRRRGLGQELLSDYIQLCSSVHCSHLFLEVHEKNIGALSLYTKNGYTPYARRSGYYQNGDALCMKREIASSKDQ